MAELSVVARRLRQARLRAGLSQRQLGIKAGIDPFAASARINQYERGKHTPDIGTAARLARVLAVPAPFLYAQDNALASWILAFDEVRPSLRRSILRKLTDHRSAGSSGDRWVLTLGSANGTPRLSPSGSSSPVSSCRACRLTAPSDFVSLLWAASSNRRHTAGHSSNRGRTCRKRL